MATKQVPWLLGSRMSIIDGHVYMDRVPALSRVMTFIRILFVPLNLKVPLSVDDTRGSARDIRDSRFPENRV